MIYTIGKWYKLLADAYQCQMMPDSNVGKLLVLLVRCALVPVSTSQCQICATPTRL
jgi:hypothetical protein